MAKIVFRGKISWLCVLLSFYAICLGGINTRLSAHEIRPVYMEIIQKTYEDYHFYLKVPAESNFRLNIQVLVPQTCDSAGDFRRIRTTGAFVETWQMHCSEGLEGKEITLQGLQGMLTDALIRVEWQNGFVQTALIRPDNPFLKIESAPSTVGIIKSYFILGVEHILSGTDHLLFVLGLLLIIRNISQLLITISAFTVAHSITLGLATLGYIWLPAAPVEAVISLSIMLVAAEAIHKTRNSLSVRYPWLVAFIFGLIHGLGFAGTLAETGLPHQGIAPALLFFNLGVEAGQVLFITIILLVIFPFRIYIRKSATLADCLVRTSAYLIGITAAFWTIQRLVLFL
ncbi:MAG: membrane protein [Chitinophagales bacterium]|nr:MAG: membrane protein [Chitinophagales bacterium]